MRSSGSSAAVEPITFKPTGPSILAGIERWTRPDVLASHPTHMTVAQYCEGMDRKDIIVNYDYQRSDKVWPPVARSFLIESILLGYPIPKLYLHSHTNLRTRRTIQEIVDGQQRSRAILDFYHDRFRLADSLETEEVRGSTYSELPPLWQERFISYSISIDLFVAATPAEVRQIFRRMNSYTVPLNPEELRNAEYQGPFKWFIFQTAKSFDATMNSLGIFPEKALVRMGDLKLFTEIAHALDSGVTTTNKASLNNIYRKYEVEFVDQKEFSAAIDHAFTNIASMAYLAGTNLAKPYQIYSLALALAHRVRPVPGLEGVIVPEMSDVDHDALEAHLMDMSSALDLDETKVAASPHRAFVNASSERTNVKAQRETRFRAFAAALNAGVL